MLTLLAAVNKATVCEATVFLSVTVVDSDWLLQVLSVRLRGGGARCEREPLIG